MVTAHAHSLNWFFRPTFAPKAQSTVNNEEEPAPCRTNPAHPTQSRHPQLLPSIPAPLASDPAPGLYFLLPVFINQQIWFPGTKDFAQEMPSGFSLECDILCRLLISQTQAAPSLIPERDKDTRTHFLYQAKMLL